MRFPTAPALFVACLTLAGCASSSSPESVLAPRPSGETTSSVIRPAAPVPATAVGPAATPPESQEALAWAGPVSEPQAFAPMEREAGMPVPIERPIAFVAPENPASGAAPRTHVYGHRFRDAKPINFGRRSPHKLAVHGVDVSRWQGDIDWAKLRTQGANFAYIKATDGGDHLDPMFKKNWRRAQAAGLKRGAYHFFYWCRTAGEQADWFIRNVPRAPDALPPVIDVEWNGESSCKRRPSPARVREKMQVFMDKLERHYGQRPIIYTAPDFYRDNLEGAFPNYPFWLRSVAAHPSKVYPGRKWLFWQYSGSGLSRGVDGRIDLNVFHGSEGEWHDFIAARSI
ncbi:Phage lysin, glycosyl hydrolase, family 25 (plasmid) [Sinorhizobium sojae CCBAU 05684]|uniref:Phage lysin, glycosyl hydrolase, family 25 n=1 Tax=Sinorhizobium sojae CCBAU 05684 TaxID=716928 RepID=A0A249PL95_9HYPH|nr:GH25 family lysozyme [Sinorhizobium sojae]ASY66681.1 Phage lysin, glycosyl hydrolase, family 25 [Sinorhizobium sojae CCBAU 05684]